MAITCACSLILRPPKEKVIPPVTGQAEKGGRCPDGTITVARQGDDLALGWFGSIHGETVVAYGSLKKK